MTLFQVALKVAYDSFFVNLSRKFPGAKICIWCNRDKDVIEIIVRNPEDYPLLMKEVREHPLIGVLEESSDDHKIYLNIAECHCMNQNTIVRHIGELDIINVFPNIIQNGWVYHRLIVFKHKDLEELLRRFDN